MEKINVRPKRRKIALEFELRTTTWRHEKVESPPPRAASLRILSAKELTLDQARQLRLELGRAIRLMERRRR